MNTPDVNTASVGWWILRDCPLSCLNRHQNMWRSVVGHGPISATGSICKCCPDGLRTRYRSKTASSCCPSHSCVSHFRRLHHAPSGTVTNLSIGQGRLQQFVAYVYGSSTRSWQVQIDQQQRVSLSLSAAVAHSWALVVATEWSARQDGVRGRRGRQRFSQWSWQLASFL